MMQLRCPHCGAQNHVESKGLEQAAPICTGCGRMFMPPKPDPDVSAKKRNSTLLPSQKDLGNQSTESTTVSDSAPIPAWSPEKPEINTGDSRNTAVLGAIPTGKMADDISGILEPIDVGARTLQESRPSVRGLTPGGMDTTPLRTEHQPASPANEPSRAGATEWRVRSARGLVYEFGGIEELRTFLEGRTDLGTLQFARGVTGYGPLSAHPDLQNSNSELNAEAKPDGPDFPELRSLKSRAEQKLDIIDNSFDFSSPMNEVSAASSVDASASSFEWKTANEPLVLDVAKANQQHGGQLGRQRSHEHSGLTTTTGQSAQRTPGKRIGPRIIFALIALTFSGGTWFVLQKGSTGDQPTVSDQSPAARKATAPAVERAVAEFEAGNYTSAANALERLSLQSKDPQVFKYLAMALHRTNRHEEAKKVLKTYRDMTIGARSTRPLTRQSKH